MSAPVRGGLRYIPTVAFGTDLMVVTLSVFAAILGRETLPFPMNIPDAQVGSSLSIAGPMMILGWVSAIAVLGGYRLEVFGAGLDEYKRAIRASFATAAAVGIACYLLQFPLARGFFVLAFLIGIPMLVLGRLAAAPQRAARPSPRPAAAPRGHRRHRGSRRRDRQRAAPARSGSATRSSAR